MRTVSSRSSLGRDGQPSNILLLEAAAGWQVKVLDFGLALTAQRGSAQTPELAGTLAYLAPELLLGRPPSEASDLYALGMIAFGVLSGGRHPLAHVEPEGAGPLVSAILSLSVETSALDAPQALRELVVRLLARDPAARPDSAAALAGELYRAAGLEPPAEQVAVRESYLQAARFVSRERELRRLLDALRDSLRGSGRVLCIGGESGVGKSRLLDELRTQALVRGARVLRGQAVRDAGRAFHVLQDVIEPLCLELPPQDAALGVLLPLFPRLVGLLPHPIAQAPPLDAASMQERALATLERLLLSAATPQRPLVVLLEDVQWAGLESLALLGRLAGLASRGALLLVCTYRDDERPDLPSTAPGAELLKLHRLDEPAVAALSESMLGPPGRSPEVVGFLQRESEGNGKTAHNNFGTSKHLTGGAATSGRRVRPGQHRHASAGGREPGCAARAHPLLLHGERVQARTPRAG
ncbi:MAG: AAA family ATPase [Polyangia bacterium]